MLAPIRTKTVLEQPSSASEKTQIQPSGSDREANVLDDPPSPSVADLAIAAGEIVTKPIFAPKNSSQVSSKFVVAASLPRPAPLMAQAAHRLAS